MGQGLLLVAHREASAFGCAHQARLWDSETTLRSLSFFPALHTVPTHMLMESSLKVGKMRRPVALQRFVMRVHARISVSLFDVRVSESCTGLIVLPNR